MLWEAVSVLDEVLDDISMFLGADVVNCVLKASLPCLHFQLK